MTMPSSFLAPGSRSVRDSLSGALDAVGLPTHSSREARERLGFPEAPKVCFVLVDGLGAENLAARSGHASTLRSWTHLEPATTVVPSTTAAAITAVGTGQLPGRTKMLSYSLRSPASGENFSLIKWDDQFLDPEDWQSEPTLFEQLGAQSDACEVVQPAAYIGSGLTLCALRGAHARAGETLDERVNQASAALRQGAQAVYLYWGEVDHTGHNKGWLSEAWVSELEALDAAMSSLARAVPKGTMIVVTADHGMVDVTERIDVSRNRALMEGVTLVSGEERAVHLYTDDAEGVAGRWREELGERSWVLTKDEAIATGFFGEVVAGAREVMGDVLVFQTGTLSLYDGRIRKPGQSPMVGVHGSLTPEEMLVPLIVEIA